MHRRLLRLRLLPLVSALALASGGVIAQGSGLIVPTLSLSQTFTDNAGLDAGNRRSEFVTAISPGFQYSSRSGRLQGSVRYALNAIGYARDSERSNLQHALNASLTGELVENFLYIGSTANVSQQSISALGPQGLELEQANSNRAEVRSFSLSPSLRGRAFGELVYDAGLSWTTTQVDTAAVSDSTNLTGAIRLASDDRNARLGWSTELIRSLAEFSAGRQTASTRASLALTYRLSPELDFSLRGGRESTNVATAAGASANNWGLGMNWSPSDRTRVSLSQERRFFGNAHAFNLSHRMRRSVWRYSDTRDVSTDSGPGAAAAARTVNYLLFEQFSSVEPDPARRQQVVDLYLLANGLNGAQQAGGGLLSSAATVQRRQELSMSMSGQRQTFIVRGYRTEGRRVDAVASAVDDFSNGNIIVTRALSANISHRLTPASSASLAWSTARTDASLSGTRTDQQSLTASWTTRIGRQNALVVSLRHAEFDSPLRPYIENALTATLSARF